MELLNQAIDILTNSDSPSSNSESTPTSNAPSDAASTSTQSESPKLSPCFRTPTRSARLRRKPYQESWTHRFVCLAEKDQKCIPSRDLKHQLLKAGLGEKNVVFSDRKGLWNHVKLALEHAYPTLIRLDGAFEILRTNPNRRSLDLITIPTQGYTVAYLKETLGKAIAYIRPLERNLESLNVSVKSI